MNPSIIEGDRIFVNKLAYGLRIPFTELHLAQWSTPARGDVITFRSPKDGTTLVKRVVALPGDTVAMNNDKLLINGKVATYAAADGHPRRAAHRPPVRRRANRRHPHHAVMATPALPAMRNFGPVTVPADQYFVLGDNRDNGADSRYIGTIPARQHLWPILPRHRLLDPSTHLPRWERTLEAISHYRDSALFQRFGFDVKSPHCTAVGSMRNRAVEKCSAQSDAVHPQPPGAPAGRDLMP